MHRYIVQIKNKGKIMLLKNHLLFLNPSEEESKRIEKIDSFDGITEDVFNKTLVNMFNGILSKKELKKFNESILYPY